MPNDPVPAATPGLPASRRGFLRGLTRLPLIGGGVTLIGLPTAAAEPVTRELLDSYDAWLLYERCKLKAEIYGNGRYWDGLRISQEKLEEAFGHIPIDNGGFRTHFCPPPYDAPSTRAAVVLSAAGVDWREDGR